MTALVGWSGLAMELTISTRVLLVGFGCHSVQPFRRQDCDGEDPRAPQISAVSAIVRILCIDTGTLGSWTG